MKLEEMTMVLGKSRLTFANFVLTTEVIKAWFDLFQDESAEDFYAAMRIAVKEPGRVFFPTPGEIQKHLNAIQKKELPAADEVWGDLITLASGGKEAAALEYLKGNYPGQAALRRVTFNALRYADIQSELPWLRKEFIKAYEDHAERQEKAGHVQITHDEAKRTLANLGVMGIKRIGAS